MNKNSLVSWKTDKPTEIIWHSDFTLNDKWLPNTLSTSTKWVRKYNGKKVLYLHGLFGKGSKSFKASRLWFTGYDVNSPDLNQWFFSSSLDIAQKAYDKYKPDIIVGSSRGGALAMSMDYGDTPLVLMAPAWKYYGCKPKIKSKAIILHSPKDNVIPYGESEYLSQVTNMELCPTGDSHKLSDIDSTNLMLDVVDELCGLVYNPL